MMRNSFQDSQQKLFLMLSCQILTNETWLVLVTKTLSLCGVTSTSRSGSCSDQVSPLSWMFWRCSPVLTWTISCCICDFTDHIFHIGCCSMCHNEDNVSRAGCKTQELFPGWCADYMFTEPGRHILLCSFFCPPKKKRRNRGEVFTHQIKPVIMSSSPVTTSPPSWSLYHLFNTFELEMLRDGDAVCCVWLCVSRSLLSWRARQEESGKLKRPPPPDNICFNILWVDSIWTQPLTLPLSPSLGPVLRAAVRPPGYKLTCDLCPRLWGPRLATPPAHTHFTGEKRTQDAKLPLITSHARGCTVSWKADTGQFKSVRYCSLSYYLWIWRNTSWIRAPVTADWPQWW